MENFQHHGDLKASRRSEGFEPIIALTAADIVGDSMQDMQFAHLLLNVQKMRETVKSKIEELKQRSSTTVSQPSSPL
jgi:histidinol phosphatase-like enzyme